MQTAIWASSVHCMACGGKKRRGKGRSSARLLTHLPASFESKECVSWILNCIPNCKKIDIQSHARRRTCQPRQARLGHRQVAIPTGQRAVSAAAAVAGGRHREMRPCGRARIASQSESQRVAVWPQSHSQQSQCHIHLATTNMRQRVRVWPPLDSPPSPPSPLVHVWPPNEARCEAGSHWLALAPRLSAGYLLPSLFDSSVQKRISHTHTHTLRHTHSLKCMPSVCSFQASENCDLWLNVFI